MALGNWTAILGDGEKGEKVVRRREGEEKRWEKRRNRKDYSQISVHAYW